MERPPSQLENLGPSRLKQPSRLPAMVINTGRTLVETSESDLNARSIGAGSTMGPPNGVIKHKIPGLPEPASKRKTLAERAGETHNPLRSHISPPSKPSISRNDSTTAQVGARTQSSLSNGSRNTSTASTLSSVSSIYAPNRTGTSRHARMPSAPEPRMEPEDDSEVGITGKRKGTPTLSFNTLSLRKTRKQRDLRSLSETSTDMSTRSQHSGTYIPDGDRSDSAQSSRETSGASSAVLSLSLQKEPVGQVTRDISLTAVFAGLSLTPRSRTPSLPKHTPSLGRIKEEVSPSKIPKYSCTPSLRHAQSLQAFPAPSLSKHKMSAQLLYTPKTSLKPRKDPLPIFLTKEKLTPTPAWDTKGRLEDMEQMYTQLRTQFADAADSKMLVEESLSMYKARVEELSQLNRDLTSSNRTFMSDLERARADLHTTTTDLRQARRDHERDVHDAERRHDKELHDAVTKQEKEVRDLERELERDADNFRKELDEAKRKWQRQKDDETAEMTTAHWDEMEELRAREERERLALQSQIDDLQRSGESRATESAAEVQALRDTAANLRNQLEATNATITSLRARIVAEETRNAAVEQERAALISKTHFLEGNQEAQSHEFTTMRQQLQDAVAIKDSTLEVLRREEMLRRKLNATILELRGNIRVFVRTRPLLAGEADSAKVEYPDVDSLDGCKEMVVHAPTTHSATGKERNEKHNYAFDRVFVPGTANPQVFQDCQDLIQSVVDGYNVSILSYGQTGSGKTYGMSGPEGIIPSSIGLLLTEMARLEEKGWQYTVEASFVEVYNETLNDLLGDAKTWDDGDDLGASVRGKRKEKHEIHHDPVTGKTTVANLSTVTLWPAPENDARWPPSAPASSATASNIDEPYTQRAVTQLLDTAAKNRRVAATKSNERSSRSHSVFILTLRGHCEATGESSEGILNLVDLAGSERLKQSGAEGNRAKETAAINKSLSSLGDVIAALGNKKGDESHIPYRNSKLTYLLQSSLGGTAANGKSSRTLMLLHLSPLQAHWQESRSSLLFGSKVHGTHIGSAKKR